MADIADSANDLAQLEINSILSNRISQKAVYYKVCRNCKEPTENGKQFCDKDCGDDFEKEMKLSKR